MLSDLSDSTNNGIIYLEEIGGYLNLAVQSDGKIIISSLTRLNSDGSLDKTYGVNGDLGTIKSMPNNIQPDGKIISVVDGFDQGPLGLSISRSNADGSIDNTFSTSYVFFGGIGKFNSRPYTAWLQRPDYVNDMLIQDDGKIIVVGINSGARRQSGYLDSTPDEYGMVIINPNGTIYKTISTDITPGSDDAIAVAVQRTGKILVGGHDDNMSERGSDSNSSIIRYNTDGSVDGSFGDNGIITVSLSSGVDELIDLAVQPDDKIIALISSNSGISVLRFNPDGALDSSFNHSYLGDDIYRINNESENVSEEFNEGIDTVISSIDYSLKANFENLTLIDNAINGKGNNLHNILTGNKAYNILDGKGGADNLIGGLGNDVYYVDNKGDKVIENKGAGTDTVNSSISFILGANLENLTLIGNAAINGTGNALNNTLIGNSAANKLSGLAGNDILNGGLGKDSLTGGLGKDVFDFNSVLEIGKKTKGDSITDFLHKQDKIDLSDIDANSIKSGDQAFLTTYINSSSFHGKAGELHFSKGVISGDTNGDKVADFEMSITLVGGTTLVSQDFFL